MSSPSQRPVGAHVPVGGGLARKGLPYADRVGAGVVQVFVSNPRGWALSPGDTEQDRAFREGCAAAGIPVFVHAPYLINFGSPTEATVAKSDAALRHSLERGRAIGARGVVVHAGSAVRGTHRDAALDQVRRHLLPLLEALSDDDPAVLVEPTAGGGQALAARVDDLPAYLAALRDHPHLGLCLDTCHLHAAGHDLSRPGAVGEALSAVERTVGPGRLGLIHANDSKDPVGSTRDRHENVGAGTIGEDAFAELLAHPATRGVPIVVETPGTEAARAADVALLTALRDGSA